MKRQGFFFFFIKSISERMGRFVTASVSVMLAVAVITGMAGLSHGIGAKLGDELKSYGANIIVSPQGGDHLDHGAVGIIAGLDNIDYAEGQVYGRASVMNRSVEVTGLDLLRIKERGWRLYGMIPRKSGEVIAGIKLKEALKLDEGDTVELAGRKKRMNFSVSGFLETGGAEDSSFIMSVSDSWRLIGMENKVSAVLVRGEVGKVEMIADDIRISVPSADVKTVRQVAVAEKSLLHKIQLLMILVSLVVLFAAAISVAGTVGANVLERREEIGLMKALGATHKNIRAFYAVESLFVGLTGGVDGFILGYLFAQAVSWKAFGSFISIPMYMFFLSVTVGLVISLFSSHFPVRDALRYNPAVILREE